MHETPTPRRATRLARPRYVAAETLVYPKHEADARRRLAGERVDCEWTKARPGDPVPDWLIDVSPGLVRKGRVTAREEG